ncbi:transcriptional regulator [Actinorhabdospora filicis]|uniref:Transcriptional regulator n=1 Tax=Actinorhabdospora filicis TaxID=1785913 RepID=A0A9W6SRH7_9ACTN|nr:helix-turn-helix domain-containing protein [Actinorhabdospora filicis]GLZ81016.1 transcriptional regulator [Actinorhabdospora filicis]
MHRVAVLALPGVIPFELGIPSRVFDVAGRYETVTCGADDRPVPTAADFTVTPAHGPEALATADTVIIPATHGEVSDSLTPAVAAALARVRPGTRMVSICLGSYVLAAAGYLDGRRATTHWKHAEHFQRTFPRVHVDPDVLFVDDGDVLTSAGAASGLDLCLHIVRRDHGSELANHVARRCVVPPWRDGGQAQYSERPVPPPADSGTAPTRAWALGRLDRPLALDDLATHARMSRRTFTRRFRDEVGESPGRWLTRQRVEEALRLLETTDLTVDRIALRVGFGSGASLREHLRGRVGVAPGRYRAAFRGEGIPRSTGFA